MEGGFNEGGVEDGAGPDAEVRFLALVFRFFKDGFNELLLHKEIMEL